MSVTNQTQPLITMESAPWREQILLKTLDRSEINIKEAFELCFPKRNIDQISNKDSRRMSTCLQKTLWSNAGRYTGGPKRNQIKFVRMTDQLITAK